MTDTENSTIDTSNAVELLSELAHRILPHDDERLLLAEKISGQHRRSAQAKFLHLQPGEVLLALYDASLRRNGKAGLALTDRGIYFKCSFGGEAHALTYESLAKVRHAAGKGLLMDGTELLLPTAPNDLLCALAVFIQRAHGVATGRDPLIMLEPGRWMMRAGGEGTIVEGPYSRRLLEQRLAQAEGDCEVWRTWMPEWTPTHALQAFAEVPPSDPEASATQPAVTWMRVLLYFVGVALNRLGGLLILVATIAVVALYRGTRIPAIADDAITMIFVVTTTIAVLIWLRWLGRRLENVLPASKVMGDDRQPLLYLRSFHSDNRVVGTLLPIAGYFGDVEGLETMDVALYEVLREIGPLVAIGRPGEALPPAGAERVYTKGWREEVLARARESRLVVIMLADTSACRWEIRAVIHSQGFDRLLFVIPPKWKSRPGSVEHRVIWSELCDEYPVLPQIDPLTVAIGSPAGEIQLIRPAGWGNDSFPLHERMRAIARAYKGWRSHPAGLHGLLRVVAWRCSAMKPLRLLRASKTAGARTMSRLLTHRSA